MDGGNVRISKNFRKLLEDIIKSKKENEGIDISFPQATDFVYKKIENAGGIRV